VGKALRLLPVAGAPIVGRRTPDRRVAGAPIVGRRSSDRVAGAPISGLFHKTLESGLRRYGAKGRWSPDIVLSPQV
jgi:hypothetical protein